MLSAPLSGYLKDYPFGGFEKNQTSLQRRRISFAVRLPERLRARCAFGGTLIVRNDYSLPSETSLPQRIRRYRSIAKAVSNFYIDIVNVVSLRCIIGAHLVLIYVICVQWKVQKPYFCLIVPTK